MMVALVMAACCTSLPGLSHGVAYAQEHQERLVYSPDVTDYSAAINEKLKQLQAQGGGTLIIGYGKYPVLSTCGLTDVGGNADITIRGEQNAQGEYPLLFDTDSGKYPHSFLEFRGDPGKTSGLSVSISDIEIQGNNVPLDLSKGNTPFTLDDGWTDTEPNDNLPPGKSYGHPFFFRKDTGYARGIWASDIKTLHVDHVTIRDMYGQGIACTSYVLPTVRDGMLVYKNMHSPAITNCKILNTWQWHKADDSGDGIGTWGVDSPDIENNTIVNDMAYTHWMGRCGIVFEHYVRNGIINNNTISGYSRNIHIESTFGGHLIIHNRILASDNGVTLNETDYSHHVGSYSKKPAAKPDWLDEVAQFLKPDIIEDNYFRYDQERERYGADPFGGPRAFIWVSDYHSYALNGTRVTHNVFVYNTYKGVKTNRWRAYDVENKTEHIYFLNYYNIKDWDMSDNSYR